MSIDITRPLALMCCVLGLTLFLYGNLCSAWVHFGIPHGVVPLKINQPCGAFLLLFGLVIWQYGRFSRIKLLHAEIKKREKELGVSEVEQESKPEEKSEEKTEDKS